jgi:hypothetical protein
MPIVRWPYNDQGEDNAKKAAERFGGTFVSDKKSKPKGKGKGKGGIGVMIAVGPVKKAKKKSPARRTRKKA